MNLLIDLQHPAHLHFFRHLIIKLKKEGHSVLVTGRDKDILIELSQKLSIDVEFFGRAEKGFYNLAKELLYRDCKLFKIIKKFKPDAMMAIAGTFISPLGKLLGIPTYVFYDTEHATLSNLIAYPFATCIYVPQCYNKQIRWNHVRYNGYHELAYLHPHYFKADDSILKEVGVEKGELFSIVRFVSWGAAHDIGLKGLNFESKLMIVNKLREYGKVFISSEGDLPDELKKYEFKLSVEKIHDLMNFASLVFGESATMASEASMMGVPSIYLDEIGRGYTNEQEKDYGIVFNYNPDQVEKAKDKAISILSKYDRNYWKNIGEKIISEKIDVTEMLYKIAIEKPFSKS